jgi:protoporphyrinogen oxidase
MNDPGAIVIVGAGPTGLGSAHRLQQLGARDFVVVDRNDVAGGLASSRVDERGFTWDIGGHVQFSHYAEYDAVLDALPIEWLHHQRESWVWIKNRFVPYPFQNNVHRLDDADRDRILDAMAAAAERRAGAPLPANFREWILWSFGDGIAEMFLIPYNFKVWAYPPEMLSRSWVGDRVSVPDLERIRRNVREQRDDVSWGPNNTFRFPKRGGTGAIWREVAKRIEPARLRFGDAVVAIDVDARRVRLASGRELRYDTLISAMPLPELCRIGSGIDAAARSAADSLRFSSTHIVGVGLRGAPPPALARKCWMYFPEEQSPYYRVTVFSNYSPHNVPDGGHWSLLAEVSESPLKPVDSARLFDDVVAALRRDRLVGDDDEIVSRWSHFERYGYPTPTVDRDAALLPLLAELERHRIFSRGRFGAWKYEVSNQDHSFMQGVELVNRLAGVGEEQTIVRPDYVNGGAFLKR